MSDSQQHTPPSQSHRSSSQTPPVEKPHHLHYLGDFRVDACPLFKQHQCQQHRPFTCFNWHFANQRRRRPTRKADGSFNYSPDIYCDKYDENTGICPDGDECIYLHRVSGDVERKYHLRYYKTAQCVHPTDARGQCVKVQNGIHCAFAHSAADLRQPLYGQHESGYATNVEGESRDRTSFVIEDPQWHYHVLSCYKTEQCRKPARLCRQGYACPFYHNTKDRRRPPAVYKYRSTPCPAAKTVDEWLDPDLCEAGDNCQYCHTRTEQQFHPEIYKSTKCNDMLEHGYCPRAVFCAFAHHDTELHAQRTPYIGSCQPSPKEQCSPGGTNGFAIPTDAMRFGSPITNGNTPSYSQVLKQRQPMPTKPYATTELISSSYPKAPGFERGPLSDCHSMRNEQLGRLRTHSLNMGHLDMIRRNMMLGVGLDSSASLQSHSSLCRSDSGFNAVTDTSLGTLEELSLDLPPIEEHQNTPRQFGNLFGAMSSPMRIPGAEAYPPSPFGEGGIFGPPKNSMLHSPGSMFGNGLDTFQLNDLGDVGELNDFNKSKYDMRHQQERIVMLEEGMKQAFETWKGEVELYKLKAEQAEMERNRAIFERDQIIQQLEAMKIQFATGAPMTLPLTAPLTINAGHTDLGDGLVRPTASLQHSPPFNIFANDCDAGAPACARCGRDRRSDSQSSCPVCAI